METDSWLTSGTSKSSGQGLTCSRGNESTISGICSSFNTVGDKFVFGNGSDSKYFHFCKLWGLCPRYSTLLLRHESSHRRCVNKWAQLCANKTVFIRTRRGLDLAPGLLFSDPSFSIFCLVKYSLYIENKTKQNQNNTGIEFLKEWFIHHLEQSLPVCLTALHGPWAPTLLDWIRVPRNGVQESACLQAPNLRSLGHKFKKR